MVPVIFTTTAKDRAGNGIPLAQLIPEKERDQFQQTADLKAPPQTEKQIQHLTQVYMNNMLSALFKEVYDKDLLKVSYVSKNNRTILKKLKKELASWKNVLQRTILSIREDAEKYEHELKNPPPPPKYVDTEQSFKKFQSTKEIVSVREYLKRIDVNPDEEEELYEEVKQIYQYDDSNHIFEIKENECWEYQFGLTTRLKFVFFIDEEKTYEGNKFEKVERRLFKYLLTGK